MQRSVEEAAAIRDRHISELLRLPAVTGAGVGNRRGRVAIQIYVTRRLTPLERRVFPKRLEGVPVFIEATGPVRARPRK